MQITFKVTRESVYNRTGLYAVVVLLRGRYVETHRDGISKTHAYRIASKLNGSN